MPQFEQPFGSTPKTPENKALNPRALFQSRLNELLLSGAPLHEMAEMLGAEEFIEGEVGAGIRFNVKAFADEQFGVEEKSTVDKRPRDRKAILPPEKYQKVERVLLPPGKGELVTGSGEGFQEKQIFPRDRVFVELLSEMQEPYSVITGVVRKEMMRGQSYKIFIIKNREKLFFINNEEGNATFVIHNALPNDWSEYAGKTKDELRMQAEGEKIEVINYPGNLEDWKMLMLSALTIPKKELAEAGENDDALDDEEALKELEKVPDKENVPVIVSEESEISQQEKREYAPEGWLTSGALVKKLSIDARVIKRKVAAFRNVHPEWFVVYLSKTGSLYEHLHPKLIEILEKIERAPDGWMNRNEIYKLTGVAPGTILKRVQPFRVTNPEWFQDFFGQSKKESEYLHPQLILKFLEEIKERPDRALEGWRTIGSLEKKFDISRRFIKEFIQPFRATHPEWFRDFLDGMSKPAEHLHPHLVEKILDQKNMQPDTAPEGWMTGSNLSVTLGVDYRIVLRIAESLRQQYPTEFKFFSTSQKKTVEYYHQDLVGKITEEVTRLHKEGKLKTRDEKK